MEVALSETSLGRRNLRPDEESDVSEAESKGSKTESTSPSESPRPDDPSSPTAATPPPGPADSHPAEASLLGGDAEAIGVPASEGSTAESQPPVLASAEEMDDPWAMSEIRKLSWFHGEVSRHIAETLLMMHGVEGSYLLRLSESSLDSVTLTLSVRCSRSVKHFLIEKRGKVYVFGLQKFDTPATFVKHFEKQPLLGGESGVLTVLKHAYPRNVESTDSMYHSVGWLSTRNHSRPFPIPRLPVPLTRACDIRRGPLSLALAANHRFSITLCCQTVTSRPTARRRCPPSSDASEAKRTWSPRARSRQRSTWDPRRGFSRSRARCER